MNKWESVIVAGKFQPFHLDHYDYVTAAFEVSEHVIIGITNPDPGYIRNETADPKRSTEEANPFTYYERYLMVLKSLIHGGYVRDRFDIVPFPINVPESWFSYVPRDVVFLITLYDDDKWLETRKQKLNEHGIQTEVLWSKTQKKIEGTNVRKLIRENKNWEEFVPIGTRQVLQQINLKERLGS